MALVALVLGLPGTWLMVLFVPLMVATGPVVLAVAWVVATVAAIHAPYAIWLTPRYGRKVAWGCTGATGAAYALLYLLV